MSQSMHIACVTCKEHLWIGQNDCFYSGEPKTMENLRLFLIKHRSYSFPKPGHYLIYIPEPYNSYVEDSEFESWKEIK